MYHVVCHDCPSEGLWEYQITAEAHRDMHARAAGHDIEYAEVADA